MRGDRIITQSHEPGDCYSEIMIVDDEISICRTMELIFKKHGYDVVSVHSANDALRTIKDRRFLLAILDLRLPDMVGTDLLSSIKENNPNMDVIMITGHASTDSAIEALNLGATAYITKPLDMEKVLSTVSTIIEKQRLQIAKRVAEKSLRDSEEKFRMIAENMSEALWMGTIKDPHLVYVNPAFEKIYMRKREKVIENSSEWISWVHSADRDTAKKLFESLLRDGRGYSAEFRILRPNGEMRWVHSQATVIRNDDNIAIWSVGVEEDITERKKMEENLRESEMWFRGIFEESPIAINVFDIDGNLLSANRACIELAGVSSVDELSGFNIFDDPNLSPELKYALRQGESVIFQSVIDFEKIKEMKLYPTNRSGIAYVESALSSLFLDDKSQPFGYLVQIVEITERKMAEKKLHEEKERAELLLETAGVMFLTLDTTGTITMLNRRACEILECVDDDAIGEDWFETFIPQSHREHTRNIFDTLIKSNQDTISKHENPIVSCNGNERLIAWTNSIIRDSVGKLIGVLSSGEDITEKNAALTALRISEEKYRTVVNSINDMIFVLDEENRYSHFFPSKTEQPYQSPSDFIGKPIQEIMPADIAKRTIETAKRVRETGNREEFEIELESGSRNQWYSVVVDLHEDGKSVVAVSRNITERKHAESQIETERDRAMLYIDLMGHDIRNKLQAIMMGLDYLSLQEFDEEADSVYRDVIRAAEKVSDLIRKVKETEMLTIVPLVSTDINSTLKAILHKFITKNPEIQTRISLPDEPIFIRADKYIEILIYTLLSNAFEHNRSEEQCIWVTLKDLDSSCELVIADNGMGISDDRKRLLFDRKRRFGGVGLHQAKYIVDKYGGKIQVSDRITDDYQQGAVFTILLPKER